MTEVNKQLKQVFEDYIRNSPGVDDYAIALFKAYVERIEELEEQNKKKDDRIEELKYVIELLRSSQ